MKPKLFIGSSTEGLKIANAIHANLEFVAEVTVWTQEVFKLSSTTIDSLNTALRNMDFGVFVFSPDDITNLRGEDYKTVRDNVIFELGLFVGQLGKERSFFLMPRGEESFHLPTDLVGITPGYYDNNRTDKNWMGATGVACAQITNVIEELGQKINEATISQSAQNQPKDEEVKETQSIKDEKPKNKNTDLDIFDAYHDGEVEKGFSIIEEKLQAVTDGEDKIYYESLRGFLKGKNNLEEGIGFLKNLISKNPKFSTPYITASMLYQNNDLFDEANGILDEGLQSIEDDEDKALLNYNKALISIDDAQEAAAIEILKKLIDEKTKNSLVYLKMIEVLKNQGKVEDLESVYQTGLRLMPKNENILYSYGRYLQDENKKESALSIFQKLTKLFPQNSSYWTYLGNVYLTLELNGLALEAYQKGKELAETEQSWIFGNIGNIYNNVGFHPQAIKELKKAIELDPDSEYAHNRLAKAMKNDSDERKKADEIIRKHKQEINSKLLEVKNKSTEKTE